MRRKQQPAPQRRSEPRQSEPKGAAAEQAGFSAFTPTEERTPTTPAPKPPTAANEPRPGAGQAGDGSSRYDFLRPRNWRVPTRLIAILLIPVIISLVFGGLRVNTSVDGYIKASRAEKTAELAKAATELAEALENERDKTLIPLMTGQDPNNEVTKRRADTDAALKAYAAASAASDKPGALARRHAVEERLRGFAADASHELRTPVAAVRGHAELALRHPGEVPGEVRHSLERIDAEALRMGAIVEDLLLLARLDAGRPLAEDEVDLTRIVLGAVADARAAGPDHRWRLVLPEEPVLVRGDEHRLSQVVANLLANARTHTPAGTAVELRLELTVEGVELSVTDEGPGIPAELLERVFERFVRGDRARSRATGSTGLGLAIVRAVVQAHGGTVEAASRPGRTSFTVRLAGA